MSMVATDWPRMYCHLDQSMLEQTDFVILTSGASANRFYNPFIEYVYRSYLIHALLASTKMHAESSSIPKHGSYKLTLMICVYRRVAPASVNYILSIPFNQHDFKILFPIWLINMGLHRVWEWGSCIRRYEFVFEGTVWSTQKDRYYIWNTIIAYGRARTLKVIQTSKSPEDVSMRYALMIRFGCMMICSALDLVLLATGN